MKTEKPRIAFNQKGQAEITFTCDRSIINELDSITTEFIDLTIKPFHQSRTLSQNAYMWTLLDKIASKLHDTSENIYRLFVKDYGVKDYICIQDAALERFVKLWHDKGIGWFTDILRKGKAEGTTTVICYYGSSSYDTLQMVNLITPIIEEAEKLGIPTLTIDNFKKLKNDVEKEKEKS